jgi:hypothetical protein
MPSKYEIVVPTIGKVAPLKDLFLFDLENLHFLVGKSDKIWGTGSYARSMVIPVVLAVVLIIIGIMSPYGGFLPDLVMALGVLGIGAVLCWFIYRRRLLSKDGKLIQGRIIETDEGEKRMGPRWLDIYGWQFGALCAFRTPEGKAISARRYAVRNDLKDKVIANGTPVLVLYRNPHHFKVL